MCPIVVFDFKVFLWKILSKMSNTPYSENEKVMRAFWGYYLNRGPESLPWFPHRVVVVCDLKKDGNYWRTTEIKNDPEMQKAHKKTKKSKKYKGNREVSTNTSNLLGDIFSVGLGYAEGRDLYVYKEPGYEADDFAGLMYRVCKGEQSVQRTVYLHTVDRDWSQLVDDDLGIIFANARVPKENERLPQRIVKEKEVIEYVEYKNGIKIEHPLEMVYVKSKFGDSSDNLPKGSSERYITLSEPPLEHRLEQYYGAMSDEYHSPEPNASKEHLESAVGFLNRLGFSLEY